MKDYSGKSSSEIIRDVENSRENLLKQIDQLQDQFQPEQLFNSAKTAFLNSDGAEFTRNMGRSLRDNPLPVALIGAGIAWLIAGQGGPTSRDLRDSTRRGLERFRSDGMENHQPDLVPAHIPSDARLASHDIKGREVYQAEFTDVDKGNDEPGRLSKARERIGDAGSRATETVRNSVSNTGSAIGEGFEQGRQHVSDFAETAQQSVRNAYRSNPVVLGLGVAAAAALAGALLPNTRRENELLGETADDLKQQGREMADQAVEKASHIAEKAMDTAQEEAENRGYSRDTAEETATKAIDDIRDIGAKTVQTVRDETEAAISSEKKTDSDRQV